MGLIPANNEKLDRIENMIARYTCGKMSIAKDRLNNRPEQGGLSLICLREMDIAMKCSWINRWRKEGQEMDITGRKVFGTSRCIRNIWKKRFLVFANAIQGTRSR